MTVKCALELIVGAHWHCSAIVPVTVAVSAIHRSAASCRAEVNKTRQPAMPMPWIFQKTVAIHVNGARKDPHERPTIRVTPLIPGVRRLVSCVGHIDLLVAGSQTRILLTSDQATVIYTHYTHTAQ